MERKLSVNVLIQIFVVKKLLKWCVCMLQVANAMVGSWAGPPAMMNIFHKMFGSHSCPKIIQQNNFSIFQHYFIQKVGSLM